MFWIRSGLHSISISDWLTAGPVVAGDPSASLEEARQAMLDALGEQGARKRASLATRIRNAANPEALWALRPELMTACSQTCGESEGRRRLAEVTARFEGLLSVAAPQRKRRHAPRLAAAR